MRPYPSPLLVALLALAGATCARAQPSLVDQIFERHVRVKSAAGAGVLHLLYERKADPQAPPTSCYRRYTPAKGWLAEERLHGGHQCVAFFDDSLYVFRRTNYSIYRAKDWQAPLLFSASGGAEGQGTRWETLAWPLPWPPQAACLVGGELWVFGVESAEGADSIRVARLRPPANGGESSGPVPLGKALASPAPPSDLSALAGEKSAKVFWHQPALGAAGNELWSASFGGAEWSAARSVPAPYPNSDYAVAEHEGDTWLVCKARGERIKMRLPLLTLIEAQGEWGAPATVPGATDPRLDWTLDIEAISFDGSLFVFRACMDRVVAHQWSEGQWREPETLFQLSPWPTYLFWWLLANVGLSLLLLPVVGWTALRVRGRPRASLHAFGQELHMATWTRRVAAQLVDILVALLLCSAALPWLGAGEAESAAAGEGILGVVALCSAVFFAYFVISEGVMGQSLGKLLLRIMVVGRDGRRPSVASIVARNLLRPWPFVVPVAYLVGSLFLLLTPSQQRLGDLLARTYVVDLPLLPASASGVSDDE